MNSIIMKKHLLESRHDIVPCDLIVLFNKKKKYVPNFGLVNIKRDNLTFVEDGVKRVVKGDSFLEVFKSHCDKTLRNKKSVILSLQMIKS